MTGPSAPTRPRLPKDDARTVLREGVKDALTSLPAYFRFDNPVSGINATDLFALNSLLGAGIELEVVRTLNALRHVWDPDGEWAGFRFERSSQAFPDVRLTRPAANGSVDIAIGIELKGWWLLAKEGVPSLRYQVAPAACDVFDLVCVVPWHLDNAVSGRAEVIEPWIESAKYEALYRDHWWTNVRKAKGKKGVVYPDSAHPYPAKADHVLARAEQDGGGNFGRLPRAVGLMDGFIAQSMRHQILGIPAADWVAFLKAHSDTATPQEVEASLQRELERHLARVSPDTAQQILRLLLQAADLLRP
jgi:hypothetical protein